MGIDVLHGNDERLFPGHVAAALPAWREVRLVTPTCSVSVIEIDAMSGRRISVHREVVAIRPRQADSRGALLVADGRGVGADHVDADDPREREHAARI